MNEPVRFRAVREAHFVAIPLQLAFDSQRDYRHRNPLREGAGGAEIRTSWLTTFAGSDPITVMAGRAGQQLGWELISIMTGLGQQSNRGAIGIRGHVAFVADEDDALASGHDGSATRTGS